MRLLFLGDVVGRTGREAVCKNAASIKNRFDVDFLIVNGENASNGAGLTGSHAENMLNSGVDCLTLGDHAFDQKDMIIYIENSKKVVRPLNFSRKSPGLGYRIYDLVNGKSILVVQLVGRVFMNKSFDDPFSAIDNLLSKYKLGQNVTYVVVDMHAEATSEKMAMGHYLDGQVSLIVGTHTHIPTSDQQILSNGSAYVTDAGMCGDYDSIIGMEKLEPISRFTTGINKGRFIPAKGKATISGVLTELDRCGKAKSIKSIKLGGKIGDDTDLEKYEKSI
tara:strand:+ start:105 stop:938 length:834 start_codon:yes stop_codon:yes gene_type:complete